MESLRVFFTLSLAQGGWQVLGPVLNRSESSRGRCAPPPDLARHIPVREQTAASRDFEPPYVG
jgi:hypothetical protein